MSVPSNLPGASEEDNRAAAVCWVLPKGETSLWADSAQI
jgi:hypothetical protein